MSFLQSAIVLYTPKQYTSASVQAVTLSDIELGLRGVKNISKETKRSFDYGHQYQQQHPDL